jgi:hypothetical protein
MARKYGETNCRRGGGIRVDKEAVKDKDPKRRPVVRM